jgi:hypothetical protein
MKADVIFTLKLHEEIELGTDSFVKRVPNGFIYTDLYYEDNPINIESERKLAQVTTQFVPWNVYLDDVIERMNMFLAKKTNS